ncbi:MAG: right-handed parallel beta-helix repeat-containing protein, partial [Planctomycetes bacterium]|nr:right-handed parallel beta-helix repeat-containing protein [Planctomycetota bacterium]
AIIKITQAREVTIADLTLANNPKYGILFLGDGRVHDVKVYNVKFHNIWARGLKGTGSDRLDDQITEGVDLDLRGPERIEWVRPRNIEVRHCLFVADTVKKNDKDGFDGDYIAGMDVMFVDNYTVADCTFIGIRGKNGGARGGVFIWHQCDNVCIENNNFYHCDKGIMLGNPSGQEKREYHIRDSVIRNNSIIGGSNKAIEVDYGNNVEISNNTIESEQRKDYAAIQVLHISEASLVTNNTLRLHGEEAYNCDDCVEIKDNNIESTVSK